MGPATGFSHDLQMIVAVTTDGYGSLVKLHKNFSKNAKHLV